MITSRERYRGALFGLAAGDAVGTTVEFAPPGTFPPVTDMAGGPFRLQAGQWTDDTSMALCLAGSLIERRVFDADKTAAVYGQLAGAYYGAAAIPAHWRDQLAHRDLIVAFADRLHDLAQ